MYSKTVEYGQDLFDLAIQEYGTVEAVFIILHDNVGLEVEDFIEPGLVLKFQDEPPTNIVDVEVMDFMRRNELRVNNNADRPASEGGYWETESGGYWETEDGQPWELGG